MKTALCLAIGLICASSANAQRRPPPHPGCALSAKYFLPCTGLTKDPNFAGRYALAAIPKSMPWQGNTPATINAQFPVIMNWKFETMSPAALNKQLSLMKDLELSRFSHHYYLASQGQLSTLLYFASIKLTAPNLIRLKAAFGPDVDMAVYSSTPEPTRSAYLRTPAPVVIKESHAMHILQGRTLMTTMSGMSGGVAVPSANMTLTEIYNEYLFTESETVLGALAKTALFASKDLSKAFIVGYQIGGAFYGFASGISEDYGYDLVTQYGYTMTDWSGDTSEVTGRGYVDDAEIVVWDDETQGWFQP